jgi:hypothetical protein
MSKMVKAIVWSNTSYGTGLTGSFQTDSNPVVLFFAGSAWSRSSDSTLSVNLLIDENIVATLNGFTNEASSHKSLVPAIVEVTLEAGSHTATLSTSGTTTIDLNDYFTLEVTHK